MAIKLILLFLFLFFFSPALSDSDPPPSVPVTPAIACNSTPDPYFCKSVLPDRGFENLYGYGRLSIERSLSNAWKFLSMINRHLALTSTSLSTSAVRALQDCQLLMGLNIDFLQTAGMTLSSGNNTLPNPNTDQIQTFLSALLTNQYTCLDGLQATAFSWSVRNGLYNPLTNGTKLYSVSLALFTRAWVPGKGRGKPRRGGGLRPSRIPKMKKRAKQRGRKLMFHDVEIGPDGSLSLRMSDENRELFESRSRRRLLQTSGGGAIVVRDVVVVTQNGTGNFSTITDAINSAPNNTIVDNGYYLIFVVAGTYQEYITVPKTKKYVMVVGDGINRTVITGNHSVGDGWTTFNSATLAVQGEGFVAVDITVQNTAGAVKGQAVAMRSSADLTAFYSCSFEGYQDTLYSHSLRQFYRECDIYGTVDFIFGNAAVVFQNCNIYPRLPMQGQSNTITAQGRTDPNQNTGTSMQNCTFMPSSELASANWTVETYLGRPWKLYSRTVVMQSFMDSFINLAGWLAWNGTYALDTLYYAEYNNTGPGSDTRNRVTWPGYHEINTTDANNFTASNFIFGDNWLPQTGVAYWSGLM